MPPLSIIQCTDLLFLLGFLLVFLPGMLSEKVLSMLKMNKRTCEVCQKVRPEYLPVKVCSVKISAVTTSVLYHTEVCWLSWSNMKRHVIDLRDELLVVLYGEGT